MGWGWLASGTVDEQWSARGAACLVLLGCPSGCSGVEREPFQGWVAGMARCWALRDQAPAFRVFVMRVRVAGGPGGGAPWVCCLVVG
jgi:hypothetical protein